MDQDLSLIGQSAPVTFEDFKHQNGIIYWWASEFMLMLGYDDMKSFRKVIDRAIKAFMSLGIDHYDNIQPVRREDGCEDYKLSRFACYLVAMNADPKKSEVAQAQAYFAVQTRNFEVYVQNNDQIDRLVIRDEIKEGHKALSAQAHQAGVEDYARFTNAGYRGMYNMYNYQLASRRGVEEKKLFETMGRSELAANLFRITQTDERIRNHHVRGQHDLEATHYNVGLEVREIVRKNSGHYPEDYPQEKQLPDVKKELKKASREMKKLDKK